MNEQNKQEPNVARVTQLVQDLLDAVNQEPGRWNVSIHQTAGTNQYQGSLNYHQDLLPSGEV